MYIPPQYISVTYKNSIVRANIINKPKTLNNLKSVYTSKEWDFILHNDEKHIPKSFDN